MVLQLFPVTLADVLKMSLSTNGAGYCRLAEEAVLRATGSSRAAIAGIETDDGVLPAVPLPVLEPYEIRERVGAGGYGVVYRAVEAGALAARQVALKFVFDRGQAYAEVAALKRCQCQFFVVCHEVKEWQGATVIVMEWMEGGTLRDFLKEDSKPDLRRVLGILESLATAVAEIHHRLKRPHLDVTPANLFWRRTDIGRDEWKLGDFGLVEQSEGRQAGTEWYAAPERRGFLRQIAAASLLSLFAVVLAIVLNAPVSWLERRRVPRLVGAVLVFAAVAALAGLLGWLVLPRLVREASTLFDNLPQ